MADSATINKITLSDEGKTRLIYLLLMHQLDGASVKYDGFDAGTGHTKKALQCLMDGFKKKYITNATSGDAAALMTSAEKPKATPKKRAAKVAEPAADGEDAAEPPAKKVRKKTVKKNAEDAEDTDKAAAEDGEAVEPPAKKARKPAAKKNLAVKADAEKADAATEGGETAGLPAKKARKPAAKKKIDGEDGEVKATAKAASKKGRAIKVVKEEVEPVTDPEAAEEEEEEEEEERVDSIFGRKDGSVSPTAETEEI